MWRAPFYLWDQALFSFVCRALSCAAVMVRCPYTVDAVVYCQIYPLSLGDCLNL